MTCGLREQKASFKQRKTDGEGIRLARKAEELMMSDVGRQGEYGPTAGACGQRRGQRGVAGRTRGGQRAGVEEAGGQRAANGKRTPQEREHDTCDANLNVLRLCTPAPFP